MCDLEYNPASGQDQFENEIEASTMAKAASGVPADKLKLYEKLVATNPSVERKGATVPYTSLNGHMFSFLTKTGTLALRLPTREREAFLKKYRTTLCEQHGRVLEEYVKVPDALLKKTRELKKFFDLSRAYVGILKPKPTTKTPAKKKAAAKKKTATRKTPAKKKTAAKKKATATKKTAAKKKAAKKKRR